MNQSNNGSLGIGIASVLSIMVTSVSLIAFIQASERRITTLEIRIESIKESIEEVKNVVVRGKK